MNESAFRDATGFSLRQVAAHDHAAVRPFPPFGGFRQRFEDAPGCIHRVMQAPLEVGWHIAMAASLVWPAEHKVVDHGAVDPEALGGSLLDDPEQRELRKAAFSLAITSADIGMDFREPDLADVLQCNTLG